MLSYIAGILALMLSMALASCTSVPEDAPDGTSGAPISDSRTTPSSDSEPDSQPDSQPSSEPGPNPDPVPGDDDPASDDLFE